MVKIPKEFKQPRGDKPKHTWTPGIRVRGEDIACSVKYFMARSTAHGFAKYIKEKGYNYRIGSVSPSRRMSVFDSAPTWATYFVAFWKPKRRA